MEVLLALVLFFSLLFPVVSTQANYHIRPTTESPCPYQDCLTLSEYATDTSRYTNSNNLTLLFLPGEHVLNTSIELQFLDSFSLLGSQSSFLNITSEIVCNDTLGFTLVHTSFIIIKALSLKKCGGQSSSAGYQQLLQRFFSNSVGASINVLPAFAALFVQEFHLDNCHLDSNYLPLLVNNSRVYVMDSIFSHNKGSFGGAVTAYNSTVRLLGQNIFRNNQAVVGGGVLAIKSSLVSVGLTSYINNTAEYGGGINAMASIITFGSFANISTSSGDIQIFGTHSSEFLHNHAQHGGCVLLNSSTLIQNSGWLFFTENSADSGGAISSHQSHINLNGSAMFEHNSVAERGGAVSVWNGTLSSAVISFVGNSARAGGAVYAADGKLSFGHGLFSNVRNEHPIVTPHWNSTHGYDSVFKNNSATTYGGGIAAVRSIIMILAGTSVPANGTNNAQVGFIGNKALISGGGMFLYNSSTLSILATYVDNIAGRFGGAINAQLNNTVVLDGENTFIGNQAQCGGGIAITSHGLQDRCYSSYQTLSTAAGSSALLLGKISLLGNGAKSRGGGVYLIQSIAQIFGNVTCVGNTAGLGGGMYMYKSTLNTSGNELYSNNTACERGGGMSVRSSNLTMSGIGVYINNTAMESKGGMIEAYQSHMEYDGKLTFVTNRAPIGGGGIFLQSDCTLKVTGNGIYVDNRARRGFGGAINLDSNSHLLLEGESIFTENYALFGGGIAIEGSTVLLLGKTSLISNRARKHGGGICCSLSITILGTKTTLIISGTGLYTNNTADGSGGVIATSPDIVVLDSMFSANLATSGVAIFVLILGTMNCFNNHAAAGGVVFVDHGSLNVTGNATYFNNTASESGGVIFGSENSRIYLDGRNEMVKNCAHEHGGAIALKGCQIQINSNVVEESVPFVVKEFGCKDNMVNHSGGALYARESHVQLSGVTSFVNNMANFGGHGGGIHAVGTDILLNGLHEFTNNSASYGGGMAIEPYVSGDFLITISRNATLSFLNNYAHKHGGAVFVKDIAEYTCPPGEYISEKLCFINFVTPEGPSHVRLPYGRYTDITQCIGHVVFEGNLASDGGAAIFGGAMYDCIVKFRSEESCKYPACLKETCFMSGIEAVAALTHLSEKELTRDPFNIMSDTYTVCICDVEKPNCNQGTSNYTLYPGETISVSVTVVGKQELIAAPVASVIHAHISESRGIWLDKSQDTQSINDSCSSLEYTLFASDATSAKLTLSVEGPCQRSGLPHYVYMRVLKCPYGFYSQFRSCVCERRLQRYTNSCDINTRAITRNGEFWVGFDHHSHGLILHPHCSFDYCKLETVSFTLNSTDIQCAHGRSGTLCGTCKFGFSLKLGSSQCSSCSNVFLLLFIPFAIAGFLLVVFLFICKVTVAARTTSGLIFYANVLAVNRSVFFTSGETNFLTVFIAWLNLDLGVETCFIDGMDMYMRTWLQFVFPMYIWLLVGIIALVSRRSTFIARIIGPTNPVSVLATLFLLSYTKLLRNIIATLSFTTLDYPDDKRVTVWVYDGNIEYFKGKHIPLFLAGLLALLLLFLPYTLLLLFGQWIEAGSNRNFLSWINKPTVKYFLDAYHAPYRNRHRYWTGMLLLVRFLLFITSAIVDINSPRDPTVNLLVLGIVCAGLTLLVWNFGTMYKKWYNSFLESTFILNMTVLALASYHVRVEGGNQTAVVHTSASVAFLIFLGIITFHLVELVKESRVWRITILPKLKTLKQNVIHHEDQHGDVEMTAPPTAPPQPIPTTFVELRESLLDSQH